MASVNHHVWLLLFNLCQFVLWNFTFCVEESLLRVSGCFFSFEKKEVYKLIVFIHGISPKTIPTCMLLSVAVLYFCSMKYSWSYGNTCIISKKSYPSTDSQTGSVASFHFNSAHIHQVATLCKAFCQGLAYADQSSTDSAFKISQYFNNFLVSQNWIFLLKWSLLCPLPINELKRLLPSLNSWLCSRVSHGPMPGRLKAPKHNTGQLGALMSPGKEVAALQMAHIPSLWEQWMPECFLYSQCGSWGRKCQSTAISKGASPRGIIDPCKDVLPRTSYEEIK